MFKEESLWIKNVIGEILGEINTVADVGSSTSDFRTKIQPFIDKNIFKALREDGKIIYYIDIKKEEGVDIICDIENIDKIGRKFDLVICSNVLEHTNNIKKIINNLKTTVNDNGYLLVTTPHHYFYHPDPIDTMYRPTNKQLEDLFPEFKPISSEIIKINKFYFKKRLYCFKKIVTNFVSIEEIKKYLPYLFKKFEVSCVLLKNNNNKICQNSR